MKKILLPISFLAMVSMTLNYELRAESGQKEKKDNLLQETFNVKRVPSENGTYTVHPEIPKDGKVVAGTELTIKATPSEGFSLDCIYHTVKGGMWGTSSFEAFTAETKITVDRDMSVGATFIENAISESIVVTHDIVYAQPGVKPLKYDVFSPKGANKLPCIVIIHGGGWSSNNEDIMRGLARELAKGGKYVVFSIDYRWINDLDGDTKPNYMHDLINDVFGAIAHIQENAGRYGADPTRMAVTGDSAGGHLSASAATLCTMIGEGGFGEKEGVYAYMPSYIPRSKTVEQVRNEITKAMMAAAPSYGPFEATAFARFVRQTDAGYLAAISPLHHVPNISDRAVPHYIVRGKEDRVIPHEMVQPYINVLKAAGQTVKYVQVEGAGHAFFDWKPDSKTRGTFTTIGIPYAADMRAFFDDVFYSDGN